MGVRAVECRAPTWVVWDLLARPDRWREWSPYVRGADGLGEPWVIEGASGHVVLRGGLRLPARITDVEPGRSWTWEVGGLTVRHAVRAAGSGSRIEHTVGGSGGLWSAAAFGYAPVVGLIAGRIARVAVRSG